MRWQWKWLVWLVPLVLLLFVVISDLFGWFYLRKPVAAFLGAQLERQVEIDPPFSIHLRPSIPVRIGAIRIGAPDWSSQPHFAAIDKIEAEVGWGVLVGRQPVLHRLAVEKADIRAERDAEGRATWSMGADEPNPETEARGPMLPVIEQLSIGEANIDLKDATNQIDMQIRAQARLEGEPKGSAAGGGAGAKSGEAGLSATGKGTWRDEPVELEVRTQGLRPLLAGGALEDLEVNAKLNTTEIAFNGTVSALAADGDVTGTVSASGSSLAELAVVPGLTLPSTPPYQFEGELQRTGALVKVDVREAKVGSSSMTAKLEYDGGASTPILRGSLDASRLVLQDLGPSIGAGGEGTDATGPSSDTDKGKKDAAGGKGDGKNGGKGAGKKGGKGDGKGGGKSRDQGKGNDAAGASRVLPDKEFNLPSLRMMDADVAVDLQKLDLGTDALRPLRSLKTRLRLDGGVLKLEDLKSNVAGGVVTGGISLDGSTADAPPSFDSRLKWDRVDLESWIAVSDELLVTGRFSGETVLKGTGKSAAAILQTLGGSVKGRIEGGSLSHQIVELAGLDAGQALGVFFSGDEPLELSCALIDLTAEKGVLRSNLFVLNTTDTIFFVQGGLNFRTEALDLRLVQSPKDWSPLSLRSPVTIQGTLADPSIGVEPMPLALKLLSSVVLAAVTPVAALLPLIEPKDTEARSGCQAAIEHVKEKAAELSDKPSPGRADGGKKAQAPRDEKGNLRQPGRLPGERP